MEKTLSENKEKIPAEDATALQAEIEKAKAVLKENGTDGEAIGKATEELLQASHKVAEMLYKQKGNEQNTQHQEPQDKGPIDADVVN